MDKKYFVEIDGVCAEGENRQEFVMNYLAALYEKNKGLDNMSRIQAYVQHFVNNFSYDKDLRNKIVDDEGLNTFEKSEEALCNLFVNKKGVCQQFSQALALLTVLDYKRSGDGVPLHYVVTDVDVNGESLAHAFNVVKNRKNEVWFIVDISSMIHAEAGDYKQSLTKFYLRTPKQYYENMKEENVEILTLVKEGQVYGYPLVSDLSEYYRLLNGDKDMGEKYKGLWLGFDVGDAENSNV